MLFYRRYMKNCQGKCSGIYERTLDPAYIVEVFFNEKYMVAARSRQANDGEGAEIQKAEYTEEFQQV